jgi:hypothetical protein
MILALALAFAPQALAADAKLSQVTGEVLVRPAGSADDAWQAVTTERMLVSGDSVKTRNGSATLTYADEATFTIQPFTALSIQTGETENINLELGKLFGKVDHAKATKPFQVITPAAVAAIRGTDVNFDFDDQGNLTVDLQNGGPVQVLNEKAALDMSLAEGRKIWLNWDNESGILTFKNSCESKGDVSVSVLGSETVLKPCEEKTFTNDTAAGPQELPETKQGSDTELPDTHSDPVSPI